jgi:hypothetical protein
MNNQETTDCRYCGKQTPMLGTKLCDPCWELKRLINHSPELARQILEEVDKTQLPPRRPASKTEIEALGAISILQDEMEEARKVIRALVNPLISFRSRRERAEKFLKHHEPKKEINDEKIFGS